LSLTDVFTVRKLLQIAAVSLPDVYNERVTLLAFEGAQLSNVNILPYSEVVKVIRTAVPFADPANPITLNDTDPFSLAHQRIVWDSVVVADAPVLTTVYVENLDYIIDYNTGKINRTAAGSAIPSGGQVFVWYTPFTVLNRGNDYAINYSAGKISRVNVLVPSGVTLYVDYTTPGFTLDDELIGELIFQMEAFIAPRLRSPYSLESTDPELKSAATNYVLYSFCLSASIRELSAVASSDSDNISSSWMKLADKYLALAKVLFSRFLSVGADTIGGLIQNRYATSRSRSQSSPSVPVGTRRH